MRTAVDTNVFSIVWAGQERAGVAQTLLLEARRAGSLAIAGVTFAEMLANPAMQPGEVRRFIDDAEIEIDFGMTPPVWKEAGLRFRAYAERRRRSGGGEPRGLLADFIVGAHALHECDRLLTFDVRRYEKDFPDLVLMNPNLRKS